MVRFHRCRVLLLLGVALPLGSAPLSAQREGLDLTYGRWWHDTVATTFSAGLFHGLLGPLGYGISFAHLDDHRSTDDRTATGTELALSLARADGGPYLVGTVGSAVVHEGVALDAWWSAGGGWNLRLFGSLALGLEARWRWEDRGFQGFWRLDPADRSGFVLQGRLAFAVPGRGGGHRPGETPRPDRPGPGPASFEPPSSDDINRLARRGGASETAARATASIVETALAVMGTPYAWGGTDDNGFDCSGLIQYAYREHGIILPRVSRDQLRMGVAVDVRVEALQPGDLLGFAVERGQISHIGLYVGEGQFIHSASGGVTLSSLTAADPDSRWWQQRWVTARRLID